MKAVILVGGEGTRLRPLTCHTPKPMLPLVNRPLLEHVIDYLKSHDIDEIVLGLCYRPDVIKEHFGDGRSFGVRLAYEVEEMPLGTAGAVKNVARHLDHEPFFVFNGDILTDLDLGAMLAYHKERGARATISLTPVDDPTAYGLVETAADGRVLQFVEKPTWDRVTTNLINAGTYIVDPSVLELIPPNTFYMFERGLFPALLQRKDGVFGYPSSAYWLDIGTPEKYLQAHHDVLSGRIALHMSGVRLGDHLWVGQGGQISPLANLTGPIVLGERVIVEAEATLVGPLTIANDCQIGRRATLENAVVRHSSSVGSEATLRECLVGTDCTVGDGVVVVGGAVVGDGCFVGPGNRLDRGIRIWPAKRIEPNTITF